jgi:homoserine dehydrogenase
MKNSVKIGLIGYGTVGSGVVKILEKNCEEIEKKSGTKIEVGGICDIRPIENKDIFYTNKYQELINREDIDIIVELIGGYDPAKKIIIEAMKAGKHIVTANKAALAKYWDEIFTTAEQEQKLVYFEASVGGAIPVIQVLNEGLAANKIEKISGILNGTTNYVLSEMSRRRVSFKAALNLARSAGFAEANPTFDLEGIDTAHKLAILSSLAWSCWVKLEDISIRGISEVSEDDISFVQKEFDYTIKLIGSAKEKDGFLELSVEPCLVAQSDQFAGVHREYNAVLIHGDSSGDIVLYGKGAGQFPAASAVVSDIMYLARLVANGTAGQVPYVTHDPKRKLKILPANKSEASYYLRFTVKDKPGVLSKISGILGKNKVSIASVYQKEPLPGRRHGVPLIMLTHRTMQGNIDKAINIIDKLQVIAEKTVKYRVEE